MINKKVHSQQNEVNPQNELFYLPSNRYPQEHYSQNFIKLFNNALTKIYVQKGDSLIHDNILIRNRKLSSCQTLQTQKSTQLQRAYKRASFSTNRQKSPDSLTERQKLIKQILNAKNSLSPARKNEKHESIAKRYKTLENKSERDEISEVMGYDMDSNKIIKLRLPIKIKQACTKKQAKINSDESRRFPLLTAKISPKSKNNLLQNLQILEKYRQLEAQYRSNEFFTSPMQIFSVWAPSFDVHTKQNSFNVDMSKLTKESIIRSKTKKQKHSLQNISGPSQKVVPIQDLHHQQHQAPQQREEASTQQQEILLELWKHKQKKLLQISTKNMGLNLVKRRKHRKLRSKEPLDEYFKPWEIQQAKRYSQFGHADLFWKAKTDTQGL